jgi:hypothetical protein
MALAAAATIFSSLCLVSCSSNSTFSSLINQGMIPVSADNPYVGSNLFLAKEMERSTYLYSFFKSKGAPQAIELSGSDDDPEVKLFYAGKREVYLAKKHTDQRLKNTEWIVRGPYSLNRESYRLVSRLPTDENGVFEIWGSREFFGGGAVAANHVAIAPAFVPTPRPIATPRPRVRRRVPASTETTAVTSPTGVPAPMNFDQRAILEAKQKAAAGPAMEATLPTPAPNTSPTTSPSAVSSAPANSHTAVVAPTSSAAHSPISAEPSKHAVSPSNAEKTEHGDTHEKAAGKHAEITKADAGHGKAH